MIYKWIIGRVLLIDLEGNDQGVTDGVGGECPRFFLDMYMFGG